MRAYCEHALNWWWPTGKLQEGAVMIIGENPVWSVFARTRKEHRRNPGLYHVIREISKTTSNYHNVPMARITLDQGLVMNFLSARSYVSEIGGLGLQWSAFADLVCNKVTKYYGKLKAKQLVFDKKRKEKQNSSQSWFLWIKMHLIMKNRGENLLKRLLRSSKRCPNGASQRMPVYEFHMLHRSAHCWKASFGELKKLSTMLNRLVMRQQFWCSSVFSWSIQQEGSEVPTTVWFAFRNLAESCW